MDVIDNLIYTTRNRSFYVSMAGGFSPVLSSDFDNITVDAAGNAIGPLPQGSGTSFSYSDSARVSFVTFRDSDLVENALQKHWFDITHRISYTDQEGVFLNGSFLGQQTSSPFGPILVYNSLFNPIYHLIYAYLVENTRIVQIFEKLLWMNAHDEKLTKPTNSIAARWLANTENLFFKTLSNHRPRNIAGQLRPSEEASRRNAYQRLFGIDLAFGDQNNSTMNYTKGSFANSSFIALFESFLREIWQAYTNARNSSGVNTTDIQHIVDTAQKIKEALLSRRTTDLSLNGYADYNLSSIEYSSVMLTTWLFFIISADTPVVTYLGCGANTPGERLINIGQKIGLPAHKKSEPILEIAAPMAVILRSIELGSFDNGVWVDQVIRSQSGLLSGITQEQIDTLTSLLLIINNWESATGHRIKNPEANITGTVRIAPPATRPVLATT